MNGDGVSGDGSDDDAGLDWEISRADTPKSRGRGEGGGVNIVRGSKRVWGVPMSVSGWGTSRRVRPARVPALCTELVQRTRRARSEIASDGALLVSAKITHFHHRRRRPDPSRSFRAQACPDMLSFNFCCGIMQRAARGDRMCSEPRGSRAPFLHAVHTALSCPVTRSTVPCASFLLPTPTWCVKLCVPRSVSGH